MRITGFVCFRAGRAPAREAPAECAGVGLRRVAVLVVAASPDLLPFVEIRPAGSGTRIHHAAVVVPGWFPAAVARIGRTVPDLARVPAGSRRRIFAVPDRRADGLVGTPGVRGSFGRCGPWLPLRLLAGDQGMVACAEGPGGCGLDFGREFSNRCRPSVGSQRAAVRIGSIHAPGETPACGQEPVPFHAGGFQNGWARAAPVVGAGSHPGPVRPDRTADTTSGGSRVRPSSFPFPSSGCSATVSSHAGRWGRGCVRRPTGVRSSGAACRIPSNPDVFHDRIRGRLCRRSSRGRSTWTCTTARPTASTTSRR